MIRGIRQRLNNLLAKKPQLSIGVLFSGILNNYRPHVIACPSCGAKHNWAVITSQLSVGSPIAIYIADITKYASSENLQRAISKIKEAEAIAFSRKLAEMTAKAKSEINEVHLAEGTTNDQRN